MLYADYAPRLDATTRAFLDGLVTSGLPPLEQQSVADARLTAAALQALPVTSPPADFENHALPVGPRSELAITVVRPSGNRATLPVLLYFHGGGWVLNNLESYRHTLAEIASGAELAIVFVEYSLSPEVRYPVAIEECFAATKWIAEHGQKLNLDPARLAVAGDSAGGNLAAAVTLLAHERGGPHIRLQVLLYPVTDANFDTASYLEFADGPFLTRDAMRWFWNHYAPDPATRANPTASPLRATIDQLRTLPPALILTAELDPVRDEGEAYAHRLTDAGVDVTLTRYPGAIHGFISLNALATTPSTRAALSQINTTLRKR